MVSSDKTTAKGMCEKMWPGPVKKFVVLLRGAAAHVLKRTKLL